MKIEVHAPGGPDLTIPLPNAMLFSPTLLNWGLKFSSRQSQGTIPEIPPEAVKQACKAIKDYTKTVGSWELVHVESSDGARVIITI